MFWTIFAAVLLAITVANSGDEILWLIFAPLGWFIDHPLKWFRKRSPLAKFGMALWGLLLGLLVYGLGFAQ